jgi:hypothetical protein
MRLQLYQIVVSSLCRCSPSSFAFVIWQTNCKMNSLIQRDLFDIQRSFEVGDGQQGARAHRPLSRIGIASLRHIRCGPSRVNLTVPTSARLRRKCPDWGAIHRANLFPQDNGGHEGLSVTTGAGSTALRQTAVPYPLSLLFPLYLNINKQKPGEASCCFVSFSAVRKLAFPVARFFSSCVDTERSGKSKRCRLKIDVS